MEKTIDKFSKKEKKRNLILFISIFSILWAIFVLLCIFYFSLFGGTYYGSFFLILTYFSWERFHEYHKHRSYLIPLCILIALAAIEYYVIEIIVIPLVA